MTDRWQTIERIFNGALERPRTEWEGYVREQTADPDVAGEVLTLLASESGDSVPPNSPGLSSLLNAMDAGFLAGRRVGPYRVGDLLGEGGMGLVYRATDTRDGTRVALKVLPPEQACYGRRVTRFLREAAALSAVRHPNIVEIREAGSSDESIHYLAMELLEGETMRQRLSNSGPLATSEAIECGCAIAAALGAAHAAGVTHRDLKPENVMLTPTGTKVFDFGIAHLDEGEDGQRTTLENALAGTAAYLSPEQIDGSSGTPRSDLFAFGAVLFEAVTARPLFQRANPIATGRAILEDTPDLKNVPEALRRPLARCLEKRPERRYASAAELEADLRAAANYRAPDRRLMWVAVIAAAILSVSAAGWWLVNRASRITTVTVPSTTDIWLAGQPAGTKIAGTFGTDSAPANSPVAVRVSAGHVLQFAASGRVTIDGQVCYVSTPDGGCYADLFPFSPGPVNGISLLHAPAASLVGVFLAAGKPSGPAPPALDLSGRLAQFKELAPKLNQQFFIGDGLTGTGQGEMQRFITPAGAVSLYLAVGDSVGASSSGNEGSFRVTVTDLGPAR